MPSQIVCVLSLTLPPLQSIPATYYNVILHCLSSLHLQLYPQSYTSNTILRPPLALHHALYWIISSASIITPFMLTSAANRDIRKLKHKSVQPHPLLLHYYSIVEPVDLYGIICFYNMFTVVHRYRLSKNPPPESPFPIRPHHLRSDQLRTHILT